MQCTVKFYISLHISCLASIGAVCLQKHNLAVDVPDAAADALVPGALPAAEPGAGEARSEGGGEGRPAGQRQVSSPQRHHPHLSALITGRLLAGPAHRPFTTAAMGRLYYKCKRVRLL